MFAHRHQDLRTPGQPMSEDEKQIILRVVGRRLGGPDNGKRGEKSERAQQKEAQMALRASVQAQLADVTNQLAALTGNIWPVATDPSQLQLQAQSAQGMSYPEQWQGNDQAEVRKFPPQHQLQSPKEKVHEEPPPPPPFQSEESAAAYSMALAGLEQLGVNSASGDVTQLLSLLGNKRPRDGGDEDHAKRVRE